MAPKKAKKATKHFNRAKKLKSVKTLTMTHSMVADGGIKGETLDGNHRDTGLS